MEGRSVDEYSAPLFIAWQLTNRCSARCITCCEESGPGAAWADELRRDEALDLARRIVESGIPYAAFGGGEPLGVAHCWELFEVLTDGGVALKLETDGSRIDDAAADRSGRTRRPMRADFRGRRDRGDPRARPTGIELRRRHVRRSRGSSRAGRHRSSCSSPIGSTSTRSWLLTNWRSRLDAARS